MWEMHNILPHNYTKRDKLNSKWFYEKCDAIIFHSGSDKDKSQRIFGVDCKKNYIIIPHGNFNESYENKVSKKEEMLDFKVEE